MAVGPPKPQTDEETDEETEEETDEETAAGATPGGPFTVTATAEGVSDTATVSVGNEPPEIVSGPTAEEDPVLDTDTKLTVEASDDGGAANLTYAWSCIAKPADAPEPTYQPNASVREPTVIFGLIGSYTLQVAVTDAHGGSVTGSVTVQVDPTLTTVVVEPDAVTLNLNQQQQFAGTARDQFGKDMTATFTWAVDGGGFIDQNTGLFTAGTTPGGPFTVTATAGAVSGTASVTVANAEPQIVSGPSAEENPVLDTDTKLTVEAIDDGDAANLSYAWTCTAKPTGASTPTYNPNASVREPTATFD